MNAVPVLEPVARRPAYNNAQLGNERAWIEANAKPLRAWFKECSAYVGAPLTEADYRGFALAQYDIQKAFGGKS